MPINWRKLENASGFPYYINESTNIKQWDHPKFADIIQRLDECNYIKYSAYRIAAKFRVLQRALYMDEVPLSIITGVFERHKLGATESTLCLESYDLEAVLSDIYFATNKQNHTNTDIDFASELMMNFLYNVYDKDRRNNIQVLSTKLVLAALSKCKTSDLYRFIFHLCADHNNCVTRLKLQGILTKFVNITSYLHEDVNFGSHLIHSTVENCFSNAPGYVGISESAFMTWLESSPQLLIYIPTLHRMKTAETVVHGVKCSVCKATPLLGLRYRCMKCSSYTQCQHCYLSAKTSYSHKLTHPMKEYCTEGNSRDFTHVLIKKLCKLLRCTNRFDSTNFVSNPVEVKVLSNKISLLQPSNADIACNVEPLSSPDTQLQVIIRQLELQNRELQQMVVFNINHDKEMKKYLEEHRLHVAAQIQKLKVLKDYLQTAQPTVVNQTLIQKPVQSTPLVPNTKIKHVGMNFGVLSPIAQVSDMQSDWSENGPSVNHTETKDCMINLNSMPSYSVRDISTWIGGYPQSSNNAVEGRSESVNSSDSNQTQKSQIREVHSDLDEVLAKLQQILANNFMLDESLGGNDNDQLKSAVNEVEGMLSSLIDGVENNTASVENSSDERETIFYHS